MMMGRKTFKGSIIFINEQLTKENDKIGPTEWRDWQYVDVQRKGICKKRRRQQSLKKFASRTTNSRFQESDLNIVDQLVF